jgi:hypothetical protein
MSISKFEVKNIGSVIILLSYQNSGDGMWVYQSSLLPGQTKHIWCTTGTLSYTGSLTNIKITQLPTDVCGITPTPSVTQTKTPTPTPTLTPGASQTPTPTPTNTPTGTPAETPTPTPTGTPAETPTPTPTETPAETPTPTPTPTLPINVTLINNSSNGVFDSFFDLNGIIPLTNLTGSFPVNSSQTLTGYRSSPTVNQPQVLVTGSGSITFNVNLNGSTINTNTLPIPLTIGATMGAVPLQVTDILIVTISDAPTPTPTTTPTPTSTPTV